VITNLLLACAYLALVAVVLVNSKSGEDKSAKHFSLFSVVTFQNTECTSDTSVTGGATEGTCYTSTECSDKGGSKYGNCASGFGVCCVFLNNAASASSTVTENRTRLRNKEFPSATTATTLTTVAYTVNKMKSDICQLRLDFTKFIIAGPANTQESITFITSTPTFCQDSLTVLTSDVTNWKGSNPSYLCGKLTGEHLYVDLSPTSTDTATITIVTAASAGTLTTAIAGRLWDIKVSQIECFASYRAPLGCHRYFMADYGKIISYNFAKVGTTAAGAALQNAGLELALQRINTCIRRSKGMCCVEYQLCNAYDGIALADADMAGTGGGDAAAVNEAFSIDLMSYPLVTSASQTNAGLADVYCIGDYVEIPSSWSASCGAGTSSSRSTINSRYCGTRLGANFMLATKANTASMPVCDCSEPFIVRHNSDDANDKGGIGGVEAANTGTISQPRGFCLDFKQMPCWQ